MTNIVLDYQTPTTRAASAPLMLWSRVGLALLAIVLPIACFVLVAVSGFPLQPNSQQQRSHGHLLMIPNAKVSWVFYPFLIYSMASAAMFLQAPLKFAESFGVRVGLWTGMLLAAQFAMIHILATGGWNWVGVLVSIGIALLPAFIGLLMRILPQRWRNKVALSIAGLALLVAGLSLLRSFEMLFYFFFLAAAAPALTLGAYAVMTHRAWLLRDRSSPRGRARAVLPLAWLVAYAGAWAAAMKLAADEFAKLPLTRSNCYIATAASRGHRSIVRSRRQLWRLKALELFIKAFSIKTHGKLRRAYDRLGRQFAGYIDDAFAADVAYLLLKPFEWATAALLIFAPRLRDIVTHKHSQESSL